MKHWLTQFFIDHPLIGGVVFVIVGGVMANSSINEGKAYAQFNDAETVTASVAELIDHKSIPAKYQMIARWKDSSQTFVAAIDLFKNEFERLKPGDEIELVMAKADHSKAMVASYYANNKPVTIAGISATPLVFVGLAMALFGLGFAAYGMFRPKPKPAPVQSRRPPVRR